MKTPEELAEEYVHAWWGPREDNMTLATRQSFLAGYQAGRSNSEAVQAAAPQWISVKDRLPEAGSGLLMVYQSSLKELGASYYDDAMWCSSLWPIVSKHITHWMPLPKPPEEYES